jgi:hypothetical protein
MIFDRFGGDIQFAGYFFVAEVFIAVQVEDQPPLGRQR